MVDKPVLIVGGGMAGLAVAKTLADSGIACLIVEREHKVGGHAREWACMATDACQRCYCCLVEDLVRDVHASDKVEVLTGREVLSMRGSDANGKQVVLKDVATGGETTSEASAVVFATGFVPYDPAEKLLWGHGRLDGVYTLAEVDAMVKGDQTAYLVGSGSPAKIAFFQCVGSRDVSSGANYCSQYCCKAALRMALKLLHECPGTEVTVFYIDLQVAGKYAGDLLKLAKQANIRLRQGVPGEVMQAEDGGLEVIVEDQGNNVKERFDRVILSIGQRPATSDTTQVAAMGLALNEFGFLGTASPLDMNRTAVPGVYVAGASSGPKDIAQTLEHAGQTAAAILVDLQGGVLR